MKIMSNFLFPKLSDFVSLSSIDEIHYMYHFITHNNFDLIVKYIGTWVNNVMIIENKLELEIENNKVKLFGKKKINKKLKVILKNNNIEYIIFPITIIEILPEEMCHANFVIINTKQKIIYRFEPHGSIISNYDDIVFSIDSKLRGFFVNNYDIPEFINYHYLNINQSCPLKGPQETIIINNEEFIGNCALWELCYILITLIPENIINNRISEITDKSVKISSFKIKSSKDNDIYYDIYKNDIYKAMLTIMNNLYNWIINDIWLKNLYNINLHRLINDIDTNKETDLQLKTLELVLKNDTIKNNIDDYNEGITTLHLATKMGLDRFVNILIENNSDINATTEDELNTPIHIALKYKNHNYGNHDLIIKKLLELKANINIHDSNNNSPFFTACAKNDIESINDLLSYDIYTKGLNNQNKNAIHYLCSSLPYFKLFDNDNNLIEKLYELGVDITEQDLYGRTPLHIACENLNYNEVEQIIKLCQKYKINPKKYLDEFNRSPIDIVLNSPINKNIINTMLLHKKYLIDNPTLNIREEDYSIDVYKKIEEYYILQKKKIIKTLNDN